MSEKGLAKAEEVLELIETAANELKEDGMSPDLLLAGPKFVEVAGEVLDILNVSVYVIKELDYDAVLADSRYLGQMRKASKRISVEPLIVEEEMWNEIKNL